MTRVGADPRWRLRAVVVALGLLACAASAGPAAAVDGLVIGEPRAPTQVVLGDVGRYAVRLTNHGGAPTPPLTAQLAVVVPDGSGSADPEDWTDPLAVAIGPLAPGAATTVDWELRPITDGRYIVFVSIFPADAEPGGALVASGAAITVDVVRPQGFTPPALVATSMAVPLLLVAGWGLTRRRSDGRLAAPS